MPARFLFILIISIAGGAVAADEPPILRLDAGHPWRPPFGLDRVGRPPAVLIEFPGLKKPTGTYWLSLRRQGKEVGRNEFKLPDQPPFLVRTTLTTEPDELAVFHVSEPEAKAEEIAHQAVTFSTFEADAVAKSDRLVNPVDLGTVLVPDGWLLLGPGQGATLELAAINRRHDRTTKVSAFFESRPEVNVSVNLPLPAGKRVDLRIALPAPPPVGDRDVVRVVLKDEDGTELWRKLISVMIVRDPPKLPAFGATALKLRFDAPISVRDPKTGAFSSLNYQDGWKENLLDVVVSLPNGGRFVFWRGSSYIPFWAGAHNTGLSTEWAEDLSRRPDAVDCVEPLMDKELRYGRVQIVESTPARVHVRWTYQSTDLQYKVWGDEAVEDYYFYPDGFGTRVVTLKSAPTTEYELSEFILIAPQDAYPFDVIPKQPLVALSAEGASHPIVFPIDREAEARWRREVIPPVLYRVRLHDDDSLTAVYFNPRDQALPPVIFGPFVDRGEVVTPAYWGSHWPLARGNATGSTIDDRIHLTPSHNSLMSWAGSKPDPLASSTIDTLDALGRSRTMAVKRWAWLIGMTDASDDKLRAWSRSFAKPPALKLQGAHLDLHAYAQERRAMRLGVEARDVQIDIDPEVPAVHPVFELTDAPQGPLRVTLGDRLLDPQKYAWDSRVLWLDATLASPTTLRLHFESLPSP